MTFRTHQSYSLFMTNINLAENHHGHILSSRRIAGLTLTETIYSPGLYIPRHFHERACFCLVMGGAYEENFGPLAFNCRPESLVWRPAHETHSDKFADVKSRCFIIELGEGWADRLALSSLQESQPELTTNGTIVWNARRLYREASAAAEEEDASAALAVEGLTLEIIAEIVRAKKAAALRRSPPPSWLKQVREILNDHTSEPILYSDVALLVGVHPVHLAREFKRYFGCTPGDYVRRLRVERAARLLITTASPLAEIALDCGFAHQAHFTRTFKKQMGLTPATFRAMRPFER